MRRTYARLAAAGAFAVVTVIFAGSALAGGNPNAPGQQKKEAEQAQQSTQSQASASASTSVSASVSASTSTSTSTASSASVSASGKSHASNGHQKTHGSAAATAAASSSSSTHGGVKPGPATTHWTHCTTGGTASAATCTSSDNGHTPQTNADVSKLYGNGKTAAQIAVSRGGVNVQLTGPGNSQPHKVTACGKPSNRSGGVDVHAVKSYSAAACSPPAAAAVTAQASAAITPAPVSAPTPPAQVAVSAAAQPTVQAPAQTAATAPPPAMGVLGAHMTLAPKRHPAGHGVLGTVTRVGGSTLPFTGLQLWLVALVAAALAGAGIALRRAV